MAYDKLLLNATGNLLLNGSGVLLLNASTTTGAVGTLAVTLDDATLVATGTARRAGTLAVTLDPLLLQASSAPPFRASTFGDIRIARGLRRLYVDDDRFHPR